MRFYRAILGIITLTISFYCSGQTRANALYSDIQIGSIPNLTLFNHLTKYETQMDSILERHNKESLKMKLDGTAFMKGTSKGFTDSAIQEQKILNSIQYRENRSRYELQPYKNGQLLKNPTNDLDSVGTECGCMLVSDTLEIGMGIWIFGGFAFLIDIVGNKFTSSYWVDEHKEKIYKLNNSDSLNDNILIPIIEQMLILDSVPSYKLGQHMTGYFSFKTANYLRAVDFEEGVGKGEYSDKNMDVIYTKGVIRFKCKVRARFQSDE